MSQPAFYRLDNGKQTKVAPEELKKGDIFLIAGGGQPGVTFYVYDDPYVKVVKKKDEATGAEIEEHHFKLPARDKETAVKLGLLGAA